VQGHHVGARAAQPAGDRFDLAGARQERQHVALALDQGPADGGGDVVEQLRVHAQAVRRGDRLRWRAPVHIDGMQRGLGGDDRCAAEDLRQAVRLGRRRGGQHPQVRAQGGADLDQEGQGQVRVEVALVALVQHHYRRARQFRVALQAPYQHSRGHHLDPGGGRDATVAAHRVAHPAAHRLAQQRRHPARRSPGRDPARLRDHDPPGAVRPGAVRPGPVPSGQGEGDQGRLACPGRCDQHRRTRACQGGGDCRQHRPDGQVGQVVRGDQHRTSLAYAAVPAPGR
jgi:hypothetical protein